MEFRAMTKERPRSFGDLGQTCKPDNLTRG